MKTIKKITQIAENLGWKVDVDKSDITFSQYTTAGQDFGFSSIRTRVLPNRCLITTKASIRQKRLFCGVTVVDTAKMEHHIN